MKLPLARVAIAIAMGSFAVHGQVDISSHLETYRTNRHLPGLMAMCIKSGLGLNKP